MPTQRLQTFRFTFLFLFLIIFKELKAFITNSNEINSQPALINLCGRRLSRLMSEICNGHFNERTRRSANAQLRNWVSGFEKLKTDKADPSDTNYEESLIQNGIKQRKANRVVKRGIVDDCCLKACTYEYLLEYCA